MPMGGSITLFSMLFVVLIGDWYGPAVGIMAGIAYGLLQLIQDPYIISIPQMLCDYIFAFGALGIGGFFRNIKFGLRPAIICAITAVLFLPFCPAYLFRDMRGNMSRRLFRAYNGGLSMPKRIHVILLLIPAVSKALSQVRTQAVS
jgi:thiamine transporter